LNVTMREVRCTLLVSSLGAGAVTAAFGQTANVQLINSVEDRAFVLTIGPVDLPAAGRHGHGAHGAVYPPIATVEIPFDGYLNSLRYELVDGAGNMLPHEMLHHMNLNDPDHRELFLPIQRRIVAVSSETPPLEMPPDLMGYPVRRGQRIEVSAMLHNPTDESLEDVTVRVRLGYRLASEDRPDYAVLPFHLDVAFPAGEKSFDLPPGRHTWSNQGSPAVPGVIMGVGAHYHDFVEHIVLEDVTGGQILWVGCPIFDESGDVERSSVGRMYEHYEAVLGIEITPTHTYRVTVTYDNPTGDAIPEGGMGVVAGVFAPADSVTWPPLDRESALFRIDRQHATRQIQGRWADIGGDLVGDQRYPGVEVDAEPSPAFAALTRACPWQP
jgi:hypothetical protein